MSHACQGFWTSYKNLHVLFALDKAHNPLRLPRKTTSKSASYPSIFLRFWLRNMLRAATARTFCTSQLPKAVWDHKFFTLFPSTCASRRNGVHFLNISTSKSAPAMVCFVHFDLEMCFAPQRRAIFHLSSGHTRRFSEPTFRPSGATNHWRNTVFRDFPTFSRAWIFFLLRISLFWYSFFFSSLLWLFPSLLFICPYCRKFDF